MQVKLFTAQNEMQINQIKTVTMLQWTHNVKLMIQKVEKIPHNDMRQYFCFEE